MNDDRINIEDSASESAIAVRLSGPMFERASSETWNSIFGKEGAHHNIFNIPEKRAMEALRAFFPDGEADEFNFVLFSTSGVHGFYLTIEECWAEKEAVTFLVVQPRLVCLRYGNARMETEEDFRFLLKLRESSRKAMMEIGE